MLIKTLPVAIAAALFSATSFAASVGVDTNVMGIAVEKKVDVNTDAVTDKGDKASAAAQSKLDKAAAQKAKLLNKADKKSAAVKEQAATVDSMTGLNTSAHVGHAEAKKAEAQSKVDAVEQKANDAKAQGDAANDAVKNAPTKANEKIQGKLNKALGG